MPIAFPTLPPLPPEFPAAGTDAQRDQWLRLCALHATKASVQASEASAEANGKLAATHTQMLAAQVAHTEMLRVEAERNATQSDAWTSAINGLTARLGSLTVGGGTGGSTDGITDKDIEQLGKLKEVLGDGQSGAA
jgi:hypothetical protein